MLSPWVRAAGSTASAKRLSLVAPWRLPCAEMGGAGFGPSDRPCSTCVDAYYSPTAWPTVKLVHAADLHLDSPLVGLERYDGAPADDLRGATRRAFENLIALCLDEEVDAVLLAGDVYDGDWRDYNTGLFFASQLTKLREAGVRVFLISGNHDAASVIAHQLRLPDNAALLASARPETLVIDELGLAVHGQSFGRREVADNLALAYPSPVSGLFNIGLLHTSVTGRPGHASYAPCKLADLVGKAYDYWALGHVHTREVLSADPWVIFAGNLQGRTARESGPKGATLVEVEDGRVVATASRDLDVVRWAVRALDVTGAAGLDDVLERLSSAIATEVERADNRLLALRIRLEGACPAARELARQHERTLAEVRQAATDTGNGQVWVEKVELKTRSALVIDDLLAREDASAELVRAFRDLAADDATLGELAGELASLTSRLPIELRDGDDSLDLADGGVLERLVADAEQLVLARLVASEAAA